jgi:hypothetical protein
MKFARPLIVATTTLLTLLTFSVHAKSFECTTTDGVYRPPGSIALVSAAKRDKSIVGRVFIVETLLSRVAGSALFKTDEQRVEVLTNTDDEYQMLWRNKHEDLTTLRVSRFKNEWMFSYFNSWQGLLLAGRCREV